MIMMTPETMNAIATKAENELPAGARLGVFAATDAGGLDVEVIARVLGDEVGEPRVSLVGAYHHTFDGDPKTRDTFGIKLVGVI